MLLADANQCSYASQSAPFWYINFIYYEDKMLVRFCERTKTFAIFKHKFCSNSFHPFWSSNCSKPVQKKLFLELFIGRWTYFQTIVFKKKERRTLFFNEIHWLTLASENTLEVPRLHTQIIDVFFIWKLHAQNFLCWPQWWLLTHSECVRINKLFF